MSKEYPWGKGTPVWERDATANDSDKSFTVPTGKVRRYLTIAAQLVCTATVGNRSLRVNITNGTDLVYQFMHSGNITASQNGALYIESPGSTGTQIRYGPGTATPSVGKQETMPELILPAGYVIRVYDSGAIDAAADDLTVVLHYVEYDA